MTILIVEDEEPLARIYCRYLSTRGHSVDYVGRGYEALSIVERRPPELMIVDLALPDMNGIGFAHHARARGYLGLIILMSGAIDLNQQGLQWLADHPIEADFAACIMKPIRLDELGSLVERLIGSQTASQEGPQEEGQVG